MNRVYIFSFSSYHPLSKPEVILLSPKTIFLFSSYRPLSEPEVIFLSLNTVLHFAFR